MKYVGAHVKTVGGVENAPLNAMDIGAKAFAFFTKNQLQWQAKPYSEINKKDFGENLKSACIKAEHVLAHDSYLINVGSPDIVSRQRSISALLDEAERTVLLGLSLLNFHPGSHLNRISEDECIDLVSDAINLIHVKNNKIVLVIENTAGQGSNIGYSFSQISSIIKNVNDKNRVGVCIDTCHAFASGYELNKKNGYEKMWDEFDEIIGFKYLKGMHLNDSKTDYKSRVDRHENLGKGFIGWQTFKWIMNDKRLDNIPLILETINDMLWKEEIKKLYSFIN
ncbi:MAG: deoxyribonuclease IV [Spirochaetes bacterium]|nr:deoxyribonuclease IV [Spirochaetota bacterium]